MDQPRGFASHPLRPLTELGPDSNLWSAWLGDGEFLPGIPSALQGQRLLESAADGLSLARWPRELTEALAEDVARNGGDPENQESVLANLRGLAGPGRPVLITGQQPGIGGGPLYTLLKIATVVARARTAGTPENPAVPVYWMGDDDDDLNEAFSVSLFHPQEADPRPAPRPPRSRGTRPPMVGTLGAAEVEGPTARILEEMAGDLAADFTALIRATGAEDGDVATLQMRLLWRFFSGQGLVIVRGNDPRLHRAAGDFYEMVLGQIPKLRERARQGREKVRRRFQMPGLADNSLQRPLYRVEENRRRPLQDGETVEDPGQLRCGVMLRSALQDWLLKPCAVFIGPGELDYLAQLGPLYEHLDVKRAPMLPRLFAHVLPADYPPERFARAAGTRILARDGAEERARQITRPARQRLIRDLVDLGVEAARAEQLADGRTRRWHKGLRSLLEGESRRSLAAWREELPGWWFPRGGRQERRLAWVTLAAYLGPGLDLALSAAVERHVGPGPTHQWSEAVILVDHPLPGSWKDGE